MQGLNLNVGPSGLGHKVRAIPPFPAGAANNGLSVDPVTGLIVLGNDVGSALATLLSDRLIPTDGFFITLDDGNTHNDQKATGLFIQDNNVGDNSLEVFCDAVESKIEIISNSLFGDVPIIRLLDRLGGLDIFLKNMTNVFEIQADGLERMLSLSQSFGLYELGDIDAMDDGTRLLLDAVNGFADVSNTAANAVYSINGNLGVSGSLTDAGGQVATVEGGIITSIV